MKASIRSGLVIGWRQLFESLLSPGFYIMLSVGLALGSVLVAGFTGSIGSSGFDPQASPLYDLISRSLSGAFGSTFVEKLFAEGPFLFALVAAFLPVSVYLAIASVFRFAQERSAGAVELLVYGPADGTSYILAAFLKDLILSAVSLAFIAAAFAVEAALTNLLLGPLFLWALAALFLLSASFFAYGLLCSIVVVSSSSAIALFLGISLVFSLVFAGSFTIVGAPVRTLSSTAAAFLSWISPFFYAGMIFRGVQAGSQGAVLAGLLLLAFLSALLVLAGRLIIDAKGVRA